MGLIMVSLCVVVTPCQVPNFRDSLPFYCSSMTMISNSVIHGDHSWLYWKICHLQLIRNNAHSDKLSAPLSVVVGVVLTVMVKCWCRLCQWQSGLCQWCWGLCQWYGKLFPVVIGQLRHEICAWSLLHVYWIETTIFDDCDFAENDMHLLNSLGF